MKKTRIPVACKVNAHLRRSSRILSVENAWKRKGRCWKRVVVNNWKLIQAIIIPLGNN